MLLPTALLSTHTMFQNVVKKDLSEWMLPIARHWKQEGIHFDAIYTGYLGTTAEIEMVLEIIRWFRAEDTLILVDPVMGDHGKLYSGFDDTYPEANRALCAAADVILPNLTEACFLTGTQVRTEPDREYIGFLLKKLSLLGAKTAILTGISLREGEIGAYGYDLAADAYFCCEHERIPTAYHGTGDIFSSVTAGALLRGCTREEALQMAARYTAAAIEETRKHPGEARYGVDFEATIPYLLEMLNKTACAETTMQEQ